MTSESAQNLIFNALFEAISGTDLEVRTHAGLAGASVAGPVVEAYVIALPIGGYQIEIWRTTGRDPYIIDRRADLTEAVAVAISTAQHRRRSSARTTRR